VVLISGAESFLDWALSYVQHFSCEQLFRDQKCGVFQLESSSLRQLERIERLLLVAITVLAGSLQGRSPSWQVCAAGWICLEARHQFFADQTGRIAGVFGPMLYGCLDGVAVDPYPEAGAMRPQRIGQEKACGSIVFQS